MGRYVSTNLGTTFGLQRLQLLYGIRNLLTSIRALSHLARTSCPIKPHRLYLNCHPSECNSGWNNFFKKSKQRPMRTTYPSLKHEAKLYNVQVSRMFSASKRETFKQEVPLRVKDTVQMQWMQIRFGDTFKRLSKHINMYFKQKEMSASCGTGQAVFVSVMQKPFIGVQRQAQTQNTTEGKEARELKQMQYPSISQSQESHLTSGYPGLQLFHMSSLVTRFGESYSYVASHINSVFLKQVYKEVPSSEDILGINRTIFKRVGKNQIKENMSQETGQTHYNEATLDVNNTDVCSSLEEGYLHFARHINRYFGAKVTDTVKESTHQQGKDSDRNTLAMRRQLAEDRTRFLLANLEKARARSSISSCVEDLNAHLILNPTCKSVVWQEKSAMHILKHCRLFWMDKKLQAAFRETLALIGYMDPLKGWGIRMLSIDGGGTRGVVPLQVLKQLEARTGKRVYQLFDYVCGVSTGAVLAFMLALAHFSIEECEEMYRRFGSDVFRQNPLVGTVKMGWSHSYYNTEKWEMILKEKIGDQLLVRTARDDRSPKVSAVSAVVNWGTSPKPFIFRNYNHSPGRLSRYAGGSGYQLWQAVRASSAAPGYFQEFPLYNDIHQDGGIILNNPCALAVHESRLLWPNQQFQCVLSLGTGRYDNARRGPATSTSLRAKISNLISSATDTEGVHTLLADLLEPNVYFRFNPMLSAEVSLDESRPSALKQLQLDTQQYLERNEAKMKLLCSVLGEERTTLGRTRDWISEKAWQLQQHWA
ncbi:hypothetical protein Q7C36_019176 [Tachysurus vachellii]|uniref:PNPLA domain-containing protein n=1 Tax=Tachysurus vachellii TaxID=175792 RepID=A0AA88LW06_TACVA|nr:hypothetical protein Q7C36_019176 [Tachysurus vachellii]